MNVLVVSRLYPRPSDPVLGIFVEEEVRELSRHCQIKVISPVPWFPPLRRFHRWYAYSQAPEREIIEGVEVLRPRVVLLPRNLLFPLMGFSFYLSLRRLLSKLAWEQPPDLIHAHMAYPDGFAAVLLGQALGCPTVVSVHGGDVNLYFRHFFGRRLGLWTISHADRVITASESLLHAVVNEHGADARKITVIPAGVDVSRFTPMPLDKAEDKLGLARGASRILYVGGITEAKGIEYLLKAFARLLRESPESAQLCLVGDGDHLEAARLSVQQLGIAASVTFVGKRPNQEIPAWINASEVLVLPSLSEGFGVVLIEAMACGKPVVATNCGGPEDIVTPETGILVAPRDEVALAEALTAVLANGHRFSAQTIRQYAVDNFAYHRVGARILDLYGQLLDR
jgi:teichuronic acid biosynthesis glycosyltransferase TuaC